ncbi:MAG: hypothetical protein ACXU8N_03565 [Telluria sp.]
MILDHPMRRSLLIAAAYLLAGVVLRELGQLRLVSADAGVRMMGLLMGSVVLVTANAIPKKLVPLARLSCDPVREQALRRFGGWALVLGSLGYTLAYALAPIEIAGTLAISMLAPAVLLVAGASAYCAWTRRRAKLRRL